MPSLTVRDDRTLFYDVRGDGELLVCHLGRVQDHVGMDRMDLLGHSHGSLVALLYAARYQSGSVG
jgi:hypothetical protein